MENAMPLCETEKFALHEYKFVKFGVDPSMPVLNFEIFKAWLDTYPFIRSLIRESLCPRTWTLKPIHAIKPSINTDFTITEFGGQPSPKKQSMSNTKRLAKYSNSSQRLKEGEEQD